MSDTIVAIATASGTGSISIVRISGKEAISISKSIAPKASYRPRYCDLTSLYGVDGDMIDQAIVIYFQNPNSFTGEDIVEFQCHGGLIVAREILDSAIYHGARLAEPGEFSKRASLNGKIGLTEAEAIAKLIEAKSTVAAKILARQLKGQLGRFVSQSRDALLKSAAYSEVMIDYAEEDIPEDIIKQLITQLDDMSNTFEKIVSDSLRRRGLIDGFRVAIIGKPNAGKSSLLNALLSYDRAIVSDIAGTTRDTIEEHINIGSHMIRLIDTAGIRQNSTDKIEKIGIERSMASVADADVIVAIFDGSSDFDDADKKIVKLLKENSDKQIIVAINKSDLAQKISKDKLSDFEPLYISAKVDFEPLVKKLAQILDETSSGDDLMLISSRQIDAVSSSQQELAQAREPLIRGELEFFSYHLQEAIRHLASMTSPYDNEEILDKMFGEFCLGK